MLYSVGEYVFIYLYYEIDLFNKYELIDFVYVNEKFVIIGGYLDELFGKVIYLMFCNF